METSNRSRLGFATSNRPTRGTTNFLLYPPDDESGGYFGSACGPRPSSRFASGLACTVLTQSSSNLVWAFALVRGQSLLFLTEIRNPRWPPVAMLEKNLKLQIFALKSVSRSFKQKINQ